MPVEYDLNTSIRFPHKLYDKTLDKYHIIIAPEYPNWLILNNKEYQMFCSLQKGLSIKETLQNYYKNFCQNKDSCISIMTNLLAQINRVNFYEKAVVKKEEPINFIKKKIHIGITNGCNMRCQHCYMSAGKQPLKTIDLPKVINLIKDLNSIYGKLEIVISGGEPLTYTHFEKLLVAIKNNHIILFTNGSLISSKNIDIISECCNEVQISFEGISQNTYASIRGSENYIKVLHALDLLKTKSLKIVLAVTILPNTLSDVKRNLIKFVRNLNYDNLEVRLNDEIELSGNALTMDMSSYDKKKSKATILKLMHDLRDIGCTIHDNDQRNIQFTNCGIGTNIIINYDGKIYPCHKFSNYSFPIDIKAIELVKNFNEINIQTSNNHIKKCQFCELKYICSGGCRIDNYIKTGNMNTVICDETFKNKQYQQLLDNYKMYHE